MLTMLGNFLHAMWSGHEMLTRLYRFRTRRGRTGERRQLSSTR